MIKMSFREWINNRAIPQLKKKFWIRSAVFSLILGIAVLVDEFIKEGSPPDIRDLSQIDSHETIMLVLLIYSIVAMCIHKAKRANTKKEQGMIEVEDNSIPSICPKCGSLLMVETNTGTDDTILFRVKCPKCGYSKEVRQKLHVSFSSNRMMGGDNS